MVLKGFSRTFSRFNDEADKLRCCLELRFGGMIPGIPYIVGLIAMNMLYKQTFIKLPTNL